MEQMRGYVQIRIWFLLDTDCNPFLLDVHTFTDENYGKK